MSLLFFIPLISGLWSEDRTQWADISRIKLPLFLLPLAFAGHWQLKNWQWKALAWAFVLLVLSATVWTMLHYLPVSSRVNEAYLKSRTMITPLENDHVRFSWLVSAAFLAGLFLLSRTRHLVSKIFLYVVIIWFAVFIHILAARTGVLGLYIILAGMSLWLFFKNNNPIVSVSILALLLTLPLLAYRFVPSFHNRVDFFMYEKGFFTKTNYLQGGSDAIRVISINGGWSIMNAHPFAGAGFGDIKMKMNQWYEVNYPEMKESEMILPAAESLMYGAGAGWTGMILFWISLAVPFFTRIKNQAWFIILNMLGISGLLFDIGLEVQFGVFIYAFMILWCWKWFQAENS